MEIPETGCETLLEALEVSAPPSGAECEPVPPSSSSADEVFAFAGAAPVVLVLRARTTEPYEDEPPSLAGLWQWDAVRSYLVRPEVLVAPDEAAPPASNVGPALVYPEERVALSLERRWAETATSGATGPSAGRTASVALALVTTLACGCGGRPTADDAVERTADVADAEQDGGSTSVEDTGETAEVDATEPVCVDAVCAAQGQECCAEFMKVWTWSHTCDWCCRAFGSSCADTGDGDGWERGARAACCWSSDLSHDFGFCGEDDVCCLDAGQRGCYHPNRTGEETCSSAFCCSGAWDEATRICR